MTEQSAMGDKAGDKAVGGTVIRSFSYGGGTQSTAALVLAARGEIDFPLFIFANVGEDSEFSGTLAYVEQFAKPYAEAKGVELVEVRKHTRDGRPQTLMQRINASERSVPIPVRMGHNGAPGNRSCTAEFKIRVVEKELRRRGATKENRAVVGIGISTNEFERAGSAEDPRSPYQLREYPLITLGLSRDDCESIIRAEGLPLPPRSACFFCPFHTDHEWRRLAQNSPAEFKKACQLERLLHKRGKRLGRGDFYFSRHGDFLDVLFDDSWLPLFNDRRDATCDTGYCMT